MPTADNATACGSIQAMLARHAGAAPDAGTVADAVARTWLSIAAQLAPVIGARGVSVLLDRSLHLTGKTFPWLASGGLLAHSADPLTSLQARLSGRSTLEAADAGCVLLVTFTDLLATLIGEPLTTRLLASVWLDPSPPPEPEPLP